MRKKSIRKAVVRDPSQLGVAVSPGEMLLEECIALARPDDHA